MDGKVLLWTLFLVQIIWENVFDGDCDDFDGLLAVLQDSQPIFWPRIRDWLSEVFKRQRSRATQSRNITTSFYFYSYELHCEALCFWEPLDEPLEVPLDNNTADWLANSPDYGESFIFREYSAFVKFPVKLLELLYNQTIHILSTLIILVVRIGSMHKSFWDNYSFNHSIKTLFNINSSPSLSCLPLHVFLYHIVGSDPSEFIKPTRSICPNKIANKIYPKPFNFFIQPKPLRAVL